MIRSNTLLLACFLATASITVEAAKDKNKTKDSKTENTEISEEASKEQLSVKKKYKNPLASYQKARDQAVAAYDKRVAEEQARIDKLRTSRSAKNVKAAAELKKKVKESQAKLAKMYIRELNKFSRIPRLVETIKKTKDKLKRVSKVNGSKTLDKLLAKYEEQLADEIQVLFDKVLNFEPIPAEVVSSKENKKKFKWLADIAKKKGLEVKKESKDDEEDA